MKITFISSYIPRKCGIASYTRDLAMEAESQGNQIAIVALENLIIPNEYSTPVTEVIRQDCKQDYLEVAKKINVGSTDIVHLQHEFGLFGGRDGQYILTLAQELLKPLIVTFHTILQNPSSSQKKIIQELARLAGKVIVMDQVAKTRLEQIYGLNAADIAIILHGAPKIIKVSRNESKKSINLSGSYLMLANNLLSRNKGIEYAIEAVAKTIKAIPSLVFLIVGETHPVVKATEGESYREELTNLVKKLDVEKNVIFVNEYVSIERLKKYLCAADVYITPYLDPEQTISGTLSYAIAAGKACIATEYAYAKEMLASDKGIVVPFKDSSAISQSLIRLFDNPSEQRRLEKNVGVFRESMSWARVSEKHLSVYKKTAQACSNISQRTREFVKAPIDISHLVFLTTNVGVVQHASKSIPDLRFGYSTCDNARALIVLSHIFRYNRSGEISRLIELYTKFLKTAQGSDGKFHTFLSSTQIWEDAPGVTDGFGRAIWGLGFHLYARKQALLSGENSKLLLRSEANLLFQKSSLQFEKIQDLRTASYTILGLYYYILAFSGDEVVLKSATAHLERLANFIERSYDKNKAVGWEWFEEKITYDNFRLPQALFAAFLITGKASYKLAGSTSLKFLHDCNFDKKRGFFDFVGQDGWYEHNLKKADYDQQPLEASGAVDANLFASIALEDNSYLDQGMLAFEWFFGNNRNRRSIYDQKTKGVADGLTPRGLNLNQGSESIICFLISLLTLQQFNLMKEEVIFAPKQSPSRVPFLKNTPERSVLIPA